MFSVVRYAWQHATLDKQSQGRCGLFGMWGYKRTNLGSKSVTIGEESSRASAVDSLYTLLISAYNGYNAYECSCFQ